MELGGRIGQERLLDLTGDAEFLLDEFPLLGLLNPQAPGKVAVRSSQIAGEMSRSAKETSPLLAPPPPSVNHCSSSSAGLRSLLVQLSIIRFTHVLGTSRDGVRYPQAMPN